MSLLKSLFFSILLLGISLASTPAVAQETTSPVVQHETEYVQWMKEFPSKGKDRAKKSLKKRFGELIFGKKGRVLDKPVSVVAESPDKYWIIDQKNGTIVFVEENKGEELKIKTTDDQFLSSMVGICILPERGLLFSDSRLNEVFFLENGSPGLSPIADSIDWHRPTGIAHSVVKDEIWVVETAAHRISIVNLKGELKRVIGKRGNGPGDFNFPTHIWIDSQGDAYIVDALNFRIQIFDKNGEFINMFGESGDGTGSLARPKGIATDSFGNIYVVDALFHVVQIFNRSGRLLYYFGSQGRNKGEFWMPSGIYIDHKDNIFVSDTYNSRIQVFNLINVE